MPDVKIKRSVLQSIIRKSLTESGPKGTRDVSTRLTIGPESSSLPSRLPLSPSDRMSTQLDVERPPVDDPDYVPANSRELGYALQALAEMVPSEQVDKAYMAFQKIIERLQEEDSEDDNVQLESIRRKNLILRALMEQSDDYDSIRDRYPLTAREIMRAYSDVDLGSDESDEDSSQSEMSGNIDDDIKNNFDLRDNHIEKLEDLTGPGQLSVENVKTFKLILSTWDNPGDDIKAKVYAAFEMADDKKFIKFVKDFNRKYSVKTNREPAKPEKTKRGTRQNLSTTAAGEGQWRDMAAFFGYKAESGIRQGVLKDVIALRGPLTIMKPTKSDFETIRKHFVKAIMKGNTEDLNEVLGEERVELARENLRAGGAKARAEYAENLFRYFQGRIFIGALDEFSEYELKSGRTVREAFMRQAFSEGNLTEREVQEIRELGEQGQLSELIYEFCEEFESTHFIDVIEWAAEMIFEDIESQEKGEDDRPQGYEKPALPPLKRVIRPGTRKKEKEKERKAQAGLKK